MIEQKPQRAKQPAATLIGATPPDRRRAMRRPIRTRVALKTDKAIFFMESVDVSTTGIRLQSEVAVEVGTTCRLVPFFEDVEQLFEATGTVVRIASSKGEETHMGIQFSPLSSAELEALLHILERDEPAPAARLAHG